MAVRSCLDSLIRGWLIRGWLAAGVLETGQVLEAADRQAQVEFGEKRLQEVGQAFGTAVGQCVGVRPAEADGDGRHRRRT